MKQKLKLVTEKLEEEKKLTIGEKLIIPVVLIIGFIIWLCETAWKIAKWLFDIGRVVVATMFLGLLVGGFVAAVMFAYKYLLALIS